MFRLLVCSTAMALLTMTLGCGKAGIGTVPVTGKVLMNGQPLEGATVVFNPNGQGRASSGTTDAAGVFKLTTETNGDGALPGDYQIAVTKYEGKGIPMPDTSNMSPEEAMDAQYRALDKAGGKTPPAKNLIPALYGNAKGSGLVASVKESGPNDFPLELKSK